MSETINDSQLIITTVNAGCIKHPSQFQSLLKIPDVEFIPMLPAVQDQIKAWHEAIGESALK